MFSDAEILSRELGIDITLIRNALAECGSPERINNHPETSPSNRLIAWTNGHYSKASRGIVIAGKIGIEKMRGQCPNFDAWLKRLWPKIRKAVEFCWVPGGWDADVDGVMEGCQHNTMDVEYYGPNPQMEFLYLAALKAAASIAESQGDAAFAKTCRGLLAKGSAWTERNLFNGEYYEHRVASARGEWLKGTKAGWCSLGDPDDPDFQLGSGCLIDQLVGDYAARTVGLGPVADYAHARKATETILARNRREPDAPVFNHMRDFVLAGERSLMMAWYPPDRKPKTPFPYYSETMTGFEYVVAANLAQRGDFARAGQVVRDIRSRYDGRKRNPFDEAECGHHYSRALDAWSVLKAWK